MTRRWALVFFGQNVVERADELHREDYGEDCFPLKEERRYYRNQLTSVQAEYLQHANRSMLCRGALVS